MNDEQHADSIFCAAIEIESASDRVAYLDRACGDNRDLRDRVDQLLQAHEKASRFMADVDETVGHVSIAEGAMIGPYKLPFPNSIWLFNSGETIRLFRGGIDELLR